LGIILWEMVCRCIKGVYERPFSEYTFISFDFQIILQSARNNLRPTIPQTCPAPLTDVIRACWDGEPTRRPTCEQLISQFGELQKMYPIPVIFFLFIQVRYDKDQKKWNETRKKR
jgi:hypothetical protein